MAQVRVAGGASNLDAAHAERRVFQVAHAVLGQGSEERRPAAVRVELLVRAEQLRAAGPAGVDAFGVRVPVLAREGTLRAALAQHRVFFGAEDFTPILCDGADTRQ